MRTKCNSRNAGSSCRARLFFTKQHGENNLFDVFLARLTGRNWLGKVVSPQTSKRLGRLPLCRCLRMRNRDRLVESQRFDVAAEFPQRIEAFRRTGAGIGNEVVEPILA